MKTDRFWMSAIWGRIGAALILIVGTALKYRGVEVTQEHMDTANKLIESLISNLYIAAAAVMMVISKLRETRKARQAMPVSGQGGNVLLGLLVILFLFAAFALPFMLTACAQKSATQQIRSQTNDPAAIALATFADAQDAYIAAAELYQPYQAALRMSNPVLDAEVVGYLRSADKILSDWEVYGDVPLGDKQALREYLREISICTAQMIEQKGAEHGQNR